MAQKFELGILELTAPLLKGFFGLETMFSVSKMQFQADLDVFWPRQDKAGQDQRGEGLF